VKPQADLFIDTSTTPPFQFGPGITNYYLRRALEDLGHEVKLCTLQRLPAPQAALPLESVEFAADQARQSHRALRIYCTRPLDLIAPDESWVGKNVVFFHGFGFNASTYLQNRSIDLYCANSAYAMRVLTSFLMYPTELAPPAFVRLGPSLVGQVSLAAPCLEYPHGYPSSGSPYSPSWLNGHGKHCLMGHALRPGKANPETSLLILDAMNAVGQKLTPSIGFKLFVSETDLDRFRIAAATVSLRNRMERLVVPLPRLSNRALIELMGHCAFSLCFDERVESFGLYALESVFAGVPVYTNGAGNLRFLLPSRCGIQVHDDERLQFGDGRTRARALSVIATAIVHDIVSGSGSKACSDGRRFIREHYNYEAFRNSLEQVLAGLNSPRKVPRLALESLEVQLGPLVRRWNPQNGRVISDYVSTQLPLRENTLVKKILSLPASQIQKIFSQRDQDTILDLFRLGILSMTAKIGAIVRLPRKN
jgi:hypothetical protein